MLFGLEGYRYELAGLLMHAEHLEAVFGVGPHTISVPRICPADDINLDEFDNSISDDIFAKLVAVIRLAVPYSNFKSKLHPCSFDLSAAAGTRSRLASRNALHFGAASCRGFQFQIKHKCMFDLELE